MVTQIMSNWKSYFDKIDPNQVKLPIWLEQDEEENILEDIRNQILKCDQGNQAKGDYLNTTTVDGRKIMTLYLFLNSRMHFNV